MRRTVRGQLAQQVQVAHHQGVLGDNRNRIAELGQHRQAAAGELQLPLNRLVAIGHTAHRQFLRFPLGGGEFPAQQLGRILLHHNPGLKIEPGGESEVFVKWAGIAVRRATAYSRSTSKTC